MTTAHFSTIGGCLTSAFAQQVDANPDAVAVCADGQNLTCRDLADAADRLACVLAEAGVGVDDCVGLYVEPSCDLLVGAWGILFAGAAYLPLAPEYPDARLRYMIEDSGSQVVVTQEHLAERAAELAPRDTTIVTVSQTPTTGTRPVQAPPDALAYVIYTSGSTGTPKGVMIERRAVFSQLRWMQTCGHLGPGVTVLQKTPMSFDAAQWEILAPATGTRTVTGTPGLYRNPQALIAAVVEHEVTTLQCVPTLLQALLDTGEMPLCTSLRRVFSGGETLSTRMARSVYEELPGVSLVNLYGPTECTINATAYLVDPDELGSGTGSVPIGVPVDNTQCFILDEQMAPVNIGETGELYIGGVQLARGYLNRPEQTRERFVPSPFVPTERLYRTGDLASWNEDGSIQFAGRVDNQVKLRGYRVELDEIALAIEEHPWVRRAAAIVTDDARTGFPQLVACVELDPRQAALMDQGNHGVHHQSKAGRLQVKAQLSDPGVRSDVDGRPAIALPGKRETERQRRETFARKTYRFYDGGHTTRDELEALLAPRPACTPSRQVSELRAAEFGEILRWFGQFHSPTRLLPKYSYASPGALYATQLYIETTGIDGVEAGVYYYHPVEHTLVRVGAPAPDAGGLRVHFLGRRSAVEPVYRNNIREVLEFETGHMVGVFEEVLAEYGLVIRPHSDRDVRPRLDAAVDDEYLGTFAITAADGAADPDPTELFVQAHAVDGLPAGTYRHVDGRLERLADDVIERRHVIAINQPVYERAAFGISAVSRADEPWLEYIALGTKLHHLQRNGLGFGFMSSGYSSKTGHPLPAARRIDDILAGRGVPTGPSYFFLGGKVSDEQVRSEGMAEDVVHMRGPAEIIKDELATTLPDYMIPNRVHVLDELPQTANGKIDAKALAASEQVVSAASATPFVAPVTEQERWLAAEWGAALKYDDVSVEDDFFAAGGNSLIAVMLVGKINDAWGTRLPLQVMFEHPKLADLAERIGRDAAGPSSRLVPLHDAGDGAPVFCWPGLGGYPMSLRLLGTASGVGGPFYGVQAMGINAGETPFGTIGEMATADVAEVRRAQPEGPYRLWGYSFGARVAFEAAWQLEQAGERVDELLLLCPGNPRVAGPSRDASFRNPRYVTILFSVFTGMVTGPDLQRCLSDSHDEDSFVASVRRLLPSLDEALVHRIVRIVGQTYEFEYSFRELARRRVNAPVTIFKARGDDYSFVENASGYSATPPTVVELGADHYSVLKDGGIGELVAAIHANRTRP